VASGESARQNKALANHVQEKLKALGATVYGVEGVESGEWILVDLGAVIVHIMQPATRQYYNLEELWGGAAARPGAARRARLDRSRSPRMKFSIVAVGHKMPAWIDAGFNAYAQRHAACFPHRTD